MPRARSTAKNTEHAEVRVIPIPVADEIRAGDSLADKLVAAPCGGGKLRLQVGDILVVKHKIVSKAEGRDRRSRDD